MRIRNVTDMNMGDVEKTGRTPYKIFLSVKNEKQKTLLTDPTNNPIAIFF